jgi:hypothetical protein
VARYESARPPCLVRCGIVRRPFDAGRFERRSWSSVQFRHGDWPCSRRHRLELFLHVIVRSTRLVGVALGCVSQPTAQTLHACCYEIPSLGAHQRPDRRCPSATRQAIDHSTATATTRNFMAASIGPLGSDLDLDRRRHASRRGQISIFECALSAVAGGNSRSDPGERRGTTRWLNFEI